MPIVYKPEELLPPLLSKFPLIGDLISYSLFGPEDDFQITYVHHIATATIFLAIIIWEHAKTLWTSISTFLITLVILSVLSIFFHAPLHNWLSPVVKGSMVFCWFTGNPSLDKQSWICFILHSCTCSHYLSPVFYT